MKNFRVLPFLVMPFMLTQAVSAQVVHLTLPESPRHVGPRQAEVASDGTRAFVIVDNLGLYSWPDGKSLEAPGQLKTRDCAYATFSPDAKLLAAEWYGEKASRSLSVFDLSTGQELSIYRTGPYQLHPFIFTADSTSIIYKAELLQERDVWIQVMNVRTGEITRQFKPMPGKTVAQCGDLGFSPDQSLLYAYNRAGITVWEYATGTVRAWLPDIVTRDNDIPSELVFLADNRRLRGINSKGVVFTWDIENPEKVARIEPQVLLERDAPKALIDQGTRIVAATNDGRVIHLDAETGKPISSTPRIPLVGGYNQPPGSGDFFLANGTMVLLSHNQSESGRVTICAVPKKGEAAPVIAPPPEAVPTSEKPAAHAVSKIAVPPAEKLKTSAFWTELAAQQYEKLSPREKSFAALPMAQHKAQTGDPWGAEALAKPEAGPQGAYWRYGLARAKVKDLVAKGKIDQAQALAESMGENKIEQGRLWGEIAIGQALAGDMPGAFRTFDALHPDFQFRVGLSMMRVLCQNQKIDDALALREHLKGRRYFGGEYGNVIAGAYVRKNQLDEAFKFVESLAPDQQRAGYEIMAGAASTVVEPKAYGEFLERIPEKYRKAATVGLIRALLDDDRLDDAAALLPWLPEYREKRSRAFDATTRPSRGSYVSADEVVIAIADAYCRRGDIDRAEKIANAALVAMQTYNTQPYVNALVERGDVEKAKTVTSGSAGAVQSRLIVALCQAGRIKEAEALVDETKDPRSGARFRWLVAAKFYYAGDMASYEKMRKPHLDALAAAPGAPSRQQEAMGLACFDFITGNMDAAKKEFASAGAEERGIVMAIIGMIEESGPYAPPEWFADAAAFMGDNPHALVILPQVVKALADRKDYAGLYQCIMSQKKVYFRMQMAIAAAQTLMPKWEVQPEF